MANANVVCGHDERHSIGDKCDVANESLIEYAVDQLAVVTAAIRLAADFGFFSGYEVSHETRLAGALAGRQAPIWLAERIDLA